MVGVGSDGRTGRGVARGLLRLLVGPATMVLLLAGCTSSGTGATTVGDPASSAGTPPAAGMGAAQSAGSATETSGAAGGSAAATGSDSSAQGPGPGALGALNSALAGASAGATGPASAPAAVAAPPVPAVTATRDVTSGDYVQVSTPSRNIGCMLSATQVRCDILAKTWAVPPKPASCEFDYGMALSLGATGPGALACVSDTVAGSSDLIGYGTAIRFGTFECISSQSGVYCHQLRTGHGFTLAKERYSVF